MIYDICLKTLALAGTIGLVVLISIVTICMIAVIWSWLKDMLD